MLNIRIDNKDFNYLINSNLDFRIKDLISLKHVKNFDTIHLNIDRKIGNEILDFLGDELTRVGFKENDDPNGLGLFIENIIDKFSREIYK